MKIEVWEPGEAGPSKLEKLPFCPQNGLHVLCQPRSLNVK